MKILGKVSHLDHGLHTRQIEFIQDRFANRDGFFIETFELPEELGTVPCGLRGPAVGHSPVDELEVRYIVRGERKCASRVMRDSACPPIRARTVTVIAGPAGKDDGLSEDYPCVLYTAYAGPQAPREPGDPSIGTWEELVASRAFWAQHALIVE